LSLDIPNAQRASTCFVQGNCWIAGSRVMHFVLQPVASVVCRVLLN
jgi:hypothetical protein